MSATLAAFLFAAVLGHASVEGVADGQELERWLSALDSASEPEWSEALARLSALGEPAALRALADFEKTDFPARRARARLLAEIPCAPHCARLLALVRDTDPEVRRLLAEALGSTALAGAAVAERVQELERLMLEDPNARVRAQALEALVESTLSEAVAVLDRAIERLPPGEAEAAASGLTRLPGARERLVARVTSAFAGPTLLSDGVLAALLSGYGRALAEVPGGGEEARERQPFLRALTHLSPVVQASARFSLANFLARAAELSEPERAERVLARLGEEGWPPVGCLARRLDLAWQRRGDPVAGLELARALVRAALALPPGESEVWEARGRVYEGAALYALGESAQAGACFSALAGRLEASRARREDLFPGPQAEEWSEGGGVAHMDRQFLGALAHLWLALLALEQGTLAQGAQDPRVLGELRAAHRLFLEARLVAARTGAPDPALLDSLLGHELSPHALVLFNQQLAPERRGRGLDLALALAEAFGRVAPLELPGLGAGEVPVRALGDVSSDDVSSDDVFSDPERLALLQAMRAAQVRMLQRRLLLLHDEVLAPRDPDARANEANLLAQNYQYLVRSEGEERQALKEARQLGREPASAELRAAYAQLLDYLMPSLHAHTLAGELRAEGRSGEALALCERALAVLRRAPLGSQYWSELASARFELLRGSTLMDEANPRAAELSYQEAERRLAAIQASLEQRRADGGPDAAGLNEAWLRDVRDLRGDALLSLAVNANVRLGEPARALEYFERAYELNQSAFMRVLRACYRARSGKHEEARAVLHSVVPAPSLYYNIACTHALLGEKDLALDFLERDLAENHPTPGARRQKLEWARKDPDLAGLRGEPRYERLVAVER